VVNRFQRDDQGPESLAEILSRLFTAKGWGRRQARMHLEKAWADAAGPNFAAATRVLALKQGILEIEVASAVLQQELAGFYKRQLLTKLRAALTDEKINDLRFRAGTF
jgi:predicted nucleic acid-binding Zn ribbon protein